MCSRTGCAAAAVATLTFVYDEKAAVLGPLSQVSEPGAYDLCSRHAERTSAPMGWEVVRLPLDARRADPAPPGDDLMALAEAVRTIGFRADELPAQQPEPPLPEPPRRGGHLRLVPSNE